MLRGGRPRASSMCSEPAALTPVPMATNQTTNPSRAARKPSVGAIVASRPATSTPTIVQPTSAAKARWLRRPLTAWNRLEKALAEMPSGRALRAGSVLIVSPPEGLVASLRPRTRCDASVEQVATPFGSVPDLLADGLAGVRGRSAFTRLADRLGDQVAAGADFLHAARLGRRWRRGDDDGRGRRSRLRTLRLFGSTACRILLGACSGRLLLGQCLRRALGLLAGGPLASLLHRQSVRFLLFGCGVGWRR